MLCRGLKRCPIRSIREEVGVEVEDEMRYVDSHRFNTDDGKRVVGVTFLCRYRSGTRQPIRRRSRTSAG